MILLLTFVTYKPHYLYGNTSTNVRPFAFKAQTMQQHTHEYRSLGYNNTVDIWLTNNNANM